jgi:hypothetical protein
MRSDTLFFLLALAGITAGCPESGKHPPLLGNDHLGYKNPTCSSCHTLPVEHHDEDQSHQCARCHGANGACDPNGQGSSRQHERDENCTGCHQNNHGYTVASECAACHFASEGLDDSCGIDPPEDGGTDGGTDGETDAGDQNDVPDGGQDGADLAADDGGGPTLSNALVDYCFEWPDVEFSDTNHTGVTTSLSEGQLAVEFTLLDLQGNPHTLSEMLATRPVMLLFGAFT